MQAALNADQVRSALAWEPLLPAFAAAFLGATTILPGRFNPWGVIVAVYFLATGITGLTMLGIPLQVTTSSMAGRLFWQ